MCDELLSQRSEERVCVSVRIDHESASSDENEFDPR